MARSLDEIKRVLKDAIAKEASARELGNQAEAEVFAAHIQKLLLKYELDVKDLKDNTAESIIIRKEKFNTEDLTNSHEADWVRELYGACAPAAFCAVVFIAGASLVGRKIRKVQCLDIYIIGHDMNREMLHYMCAQLMTKIRILARKTFSEYDGPTKRNTFYRSFYKGACEGIRTNLRLQMRHEQQMDTKADAIVLDKMGQIRRFMEAEFGQLGRHSPRRAGAGDAFSKGREAGQNINMDSGRASIGNKKLLN